MLRMSRNANLRRIKKRDICTKGRPEQMFNLSLGLYSYHSYIPIIGLIPLTGNTCRAIYVCLNDGRTAASLRTQIGLLPDIHHYLYISSSQMCSIWAKINCEFEGPLDSSSINIITLFHNRALSYLVWQAERESARKIALFGDISAAFKHSNFRTK